MSDHTRGLYNRYLVERADGSSAPGGKHEHCRYFVLDLDHDEYAGAALAAYAANCREKFPSLADDLERLAPDHVTALAVLANRMRDLEAENKALRKKVSEATWSVEDHLRY